MTKFAAAAAVVAAAPLGAFADGAVSRATVARARGVYGSRIAALEGAVKSGDFAAVAAEKNAFALFNSGAYAIDKADKPKAVALAKEVLAAAESKDAAKLQAAYKAYVDTIDIASPFSAKDESQGYSSDYDWKARTPKGTIYVR
ncbi:unnamed protein product [Phaeothamnion confervicola]